MIAEQLLYWGWPGATLLALLGLAVGSFLNVAIYRLPVMLERQWQTQAREVLEQKAKADERFMRRFSKIVEKHDKNLYGAGE